MISTYLKPLDEVDKLRDQHLSFLDEQEARGVVAGAGRRTPPVGGVVILDVSTEEEARATMARDPYVLHGAAEYEAIGFDPSRGPLKK